MKGTILWFDEAKDFGSILSEDGERLYVDRDAFVDRAAPAGRCARLPVRLSVSERNGTRIAVDVSLCLKKPTVGHAAAARLRPSAASRPERGRSTSSAKRQTTVREDRWRRRNRRSERQPQAESCRSDRSKRRRRPAGSNRRFKFGHVTC